MGDTVFINNRAAVHKGSSGKSMAAFPDVCLCPPPPPAGPIPTPLPNNCMASDLQDGASSVLIEGNPAGTRKSYISKSTGNESAQTTGGGIVSHVVQGGAYFTSFSFDVSFEGEPAVRHLDLMTHNHQNPGDTPPWPFLSKQQMSQLGPCATSNEDCKLVSYKPDKCPEGKTAHHVLPQSCLVKSGQRGLNEAVATFKGSPVSAAEISATCIPGCSKYRSRDAPCICVTGQDKSSLGPKRQVAQSRQNAPTNGFG